ncbi:UV radiation resistance protein and autophagy-related subunit 14-domain-containing protein [Coniochaeta sp. 2T2.1]|nr:UV radiation resistance protein and autophagy-related subunit 14-domain-containing protein [Coniochaeta sp. 2T2.1]
MSTESNTRPLLLPQNRKLRHLRGIYLRNLSFSRPRGRTIDDAAINKSPSKLEALRETPQLHHAISSESLRPTAGRRRSTNLANASPLTRQKKLEYTVESRIADVFFSLHCDGEEDAIYVSEVAERATNFNFQFFELDQLVSSVTRLPRVIVKVWTKRQDRWSLLVEEDIDLRFLKFLGTVDDVQFPPNCLVFHLVDGIYTLELSSKYPPPKRTSSLPTSSYNALSRLATLDNSIQDALAMRETIADQINEILGRSAAESVPEAEDKARLANRYLAQQRRAVQAAQKRKEELQNSIAARRAAIQSGRETQDKVAADVKNATDKLASSKELLSATRESIRGQRRRIAEDLLNIYKINPVPMGPPLSFQICGIPLPNTTYDTSRSSGTGMEDALSAALGHVAMLTNALQYYLGVPLPYPITAFASRSSIRDDISLLPEPQREFPLYLPRGGSSAQYRFDYGWFLLNKDVEALCLAQGLKVVDIRHTLPNLKYLLFVSSAGTAELPERKRGGVRGLWAGRLKGGGHGGAGSGDGSDSAGGSRRGSAESDAFSKQREELRKTAIGSQRAGDTGRSFQSAVGSPLASSYEDGEVKLTLRTKGMRENVVK